MTIFTAFWKAIFQRKRPKVLYGKMFTLKNKNYLKKTTESLLLGALQGARIGPRSALQGAPLELFFYTILYLGNLH